MNSPINRLIELTQARDAARLRSNGDKSKSLNKKVVELVASANKMALPERHVIPRHALVVMARAMKELSSLPDESLEAGVLREVTKFISLSQNTVGSKDRYVKHTDLLPAGHPMSDHNSSLSLDDFLEKYSTWISADPGISEDARQLVAAAYSQMPDTLEREHAFIRLRALRASSVPSYIKLDGISALVAAFNFGDGNSSAARRARVALQWRDRFGRWVEMGRGINFKFRLPDGGIGNASGTYVGSDANAGYTGNMFKKEANAGYVEVKGNENVPDGIYSIRNNNAEVFKARLSEAELKRAGVDTKKSARYKMSSQFDESIPDLSDLLATKVDAPSGWTKNDDGSFTSDDDYKVIPNKDGYSVYRLDPDGNTGDKVADAKTWADAQNVAAADEDAYDKYKEDVESGQLPLDDGTRPEPRYSRMNRDVQREIKQLKDQVPQNQESNERIETQLKRALSGKDSQGRDLPDGWYSQIDPNTLDENYYKDIPGATRSDEYLVAVVDRDGDILYGSGGSWFNEGKKVDSWDKVTADSPKIIDELNRSRERIGLEPISPAQDVSDKEIFDRRMAGESLQEVADSLGIPREEVRAREARYARQQSPSESKSAQFLREVNAGVERPSDFLYFDRATGESLATSLQENREGVTEYFTDIVSKVHAAGGNIEDASLSKGELPLLTRQDGDVFRIFLPKNVSGKTLKDLVRATALEGINDSDEDVQEYVDKINQQRDLNNGPDEQPVSSDIERYIVDFETLGSSDMFDGIPELEDEDPTEMTEQEALAKWLEGNGLDKLGVKVVSTSEDGLTKRVTFDIPTDAKDAFGEVYGLELDDNLGDGIDKVSNGPEDSGPGEPPSGPTTPSGDYGSDFTDMVVDGAESQYFMDRELEEMFDDEDVTKTGTTFADLMWESSDDRFDLQDQFDADRPIDLNKSEFIEAAVAAFNTNVNANLESAFSERLDTDPEYDVNSFDSEAFKAAAEAQYRNRLESLFQFDDDEGTDEPPSPGGGSRPKSPAPSSPAAPALFREFDVPAGAFQLRTVEYEPEGRIDEISTDFTDNPSFLATRYPLDTLVRSFTKSLIGDVDESVIDEIVDINDDGDGNIPDLSEVQDALEQRAPRVNIGRASGTGPLEFNAGEEFIQAEALYNAVWLAGGDPNRVIANAYDSVNGNRSNLNKLIQAQGGIPSPEDEKLIVDILDEIKQIDDALKDGEETIANINTDNQDDETELPGDLIENVPVDFKNPDYYNMDLSPYIPTIDEPDELGYTDNPKYVALTAESADLIQQMQTGITDGTGAALVRFNDDSTSVLPVEVIRDALQYQGINTNDILFKLRDESNFMSDLDSSTRQAHSQMIKDLIEQAGGTVDDETADKIRDAINEKGLIDWSEAENEDVISAIAEVAGPEILEQAPVPKTTETPAANVPVYPGPRQRGYTAENTTLDVDGNIIGAGTIVVATRDGKRGRAVSVQNDPEYVRIAFDDGTTAVRSASKVRVESNADGSAPAAVPDTATPVARTPSTDVSERLDSPVARAPRVARDGNTVGVNEINSKIPQELSELTQVDVPQTKFADWGSRDAEIAKAANTRVRLDVLEDAVREAAAAREARDRDKLKEAQDRLNLIAADIYGSREGISFGAEYYTLKLSSAQGYGESSAEKILSGETNARLQIDFEVNDMSGVTVGSVRRTLQFNVINGVDGVRRKEVTASNSYMNIQQKGKKKGFASAYNRYMENWYIANDIKKVTVLAAGGGQYQGGFVWALSGFGWASDRGGDIRDMLSAMSRKASTADEKRIIDRLKDKFNAAKNPETDRYDLSKAPTPLELALVGWYPGATNYLGKSVMTQISWNGVKHLVSDSREQRQAINYNQIRNANRRVEGKQNKPNVSSEFLSFIATNQFQTSNPELSQYIDQIRATIRNNDSLATLSPAAKIALSNFTSKEMINKDSKVPVEDTFKLRNALTAEYRADNAYFDPFQVGDELKNFTFDDFESEDEKIASAGFSYRVLSGDESGDNVTFEVTHNASGQKFYVKNEKLSKEWHGTRGIAGEVEMSILMRAMGMNGVYEARASNVEEDFIIMSSAGANLPLAMDPINARSMQEYGLPSPDGERYYGDENFIKNLKNPEDIIRMSILDMLGNNKDRHDGNWMVAYDSTDNKLIMVPVDNSTSLINKDNDDAEEEINEFLDVEWSQDVGDVYPEYMPQLVAAAGKDRTYSIYKNEVQKIIDNVGSELVMPKGLELDAIIEKWGTYDAFKDALSLRLKNLIKDGTRSNNALRSALRLGYWGG